MMALKDRMKAKEAAGGKRTLLLGPNCPGLIKLATDPKARMTQREVMVLATFADYYQFHQKLDI